MAECNCADRYEVSMSDHDKILSFDDRVFKIKKPLTLSCRSTHATGDIIIN